MRQSDPNVNKQEFRAPIPSYNAIAAVNEKGYIGKNGDLLYAIKEDMAYFAATTRGKTLVMGRKTLLSLPGGKGLKGRTNIVLSRNMTKEEAEGCGALLARTPEDIKAILSSRAILPEEVFVIGGGEIYSLLLPYCKTLYITRVFASDEGDVAFPSIPPDFSLIKGEEKEANGIRFRFDTYVR